LKLYKNDLKGIEWTVTASHVSALFQGATNYSSYRFAEFILLIYYYILCDIILL